MRNSKTIAKFVAAFLVLGICGVVDAKSGSPMKPHGVHAVIESVQVSAGKNAQQITVKIGSVKKGNLQSIRIPIGPGVTIQLKNNAAGSFSSLHAGDRIIVEPDTTNPTTIVDLGGHAGHHRKVK